jgi:hypothetical protein
MRSGAHAHEAALVYWWQAHAAVRRESVRLASESAVRAWRTLMSRTWPRMGTLLGASCTLLSSRLLQLSLRRAYSSPNAVAAANTSCSIMRAARAYVPALLGRCAALAAAPAAWGRPEVQRRSLVIPGRPAQLGKGRQQSQQPNMRAKRQGQTANRPAGRPIGDGWFAFALQRPQQNATLWSRV